MTLNKDIRAQFYARMGFNKQDGNSGHQSSSEEAEEKTIQKQHNIESGRDSRSFAAGTVTDAGDTQGIKLQGLDIIQYLPFDYVFP